MHRQILRMNWQNDTSKSSVRNVPLPSTAYTICNISIQNKKTPLSLFRKPYGHNMTPRIHAIIISQPSPNLNPPETGLLARYLAVSTFHPEITRIQNWISDRIFFFPPSFPVLATFSPGPPPLQQQLQLPNAEPEITRLETRLQSAGGGTNIWTRLYCRIFYMYIQTKPLSKTWGGFIVTGNTGARTLRRQITYCRVLLCTRALSTQNRTNDQICRERKKEKKIYADAALLHSAYMIIMVGEIFSCNSNPRSNAWSRCITR